MRPTHYYEYKQNQLLETEKNRNKIGITDKTDQQEDDNIEKFNWQGKNIISINNKNGNIALDSKSVKYAIN